MNGEGRGMKAENEGEREVNDHWLYFMSYVHRTVWVRLHEVCSMCVAWRLNVCFFIVFRLGVREC